MLVSNFTEINWRKRYSAICSLEYIAMSELFSGFIIVLISYAGKEILAAFNEVFHIKHNYCKYAV